MQRNPDYDQVIQAIRSLIRELRTPQVREIIQGLVRRNLGEKGGISTVRVPLRPRILS